MNWFSIATCFIAPALVRLKPTKDLILRQRDRKDVEQRLFNSLNLALAEKAWIHWQTWHRCSAYQATGMPAHIGQYV